MNISDFVILPGSKTGTSVKLKAKHLRELQLEKVQLELQNKEMEKKLQLLQSNMSREKEERERSSGYRWQSGQVGPMGIQPQILLQNKENGVKVSSGKVKLKILREQIQEPLKLPLKHKIANVVATENPKMKGKVCGQCETKNALLVCLECGEDYCGSCFAKIHQKGALKLHRMIPLQAKASASVGKLEVVHRFMKEVNPDESKMNHEQKKESSTNQLTSDASSSLLTSTGSAVEFSTSSAWTGFENRDGRLLLHGTFDEDESSKSFQEALTQWRHGNHELKKKQNSIKAEAESMGICEVQTHLTLSREPVQIEFKEDSLSYMEKLWLKKHRRTPIEKEPGIQVNGFRPGQSMVNEFHNALGGEARKEEEEEDLIAEDMKKYWTSLFRTEVSDTVPEFPESSLKIEVLDNSYEDDLEESSNFMVMELGSTKSGNKQRAMGPEHQQDTVSHFSPAQALDITRKSFDHVPSTADKKDLLIPPWDRNTAPLEQISKVSSGQTSTASHAGIYTECHHSATGEEVLSIPHKGDLTAKAGTKTNTDRRFLSSCMPPEMSFGLPKLAIKTPSSKSRSLNDSADSVEFNSFSNNQSMALTTKSSVLLQEVARREKPVSTQYQGLEIFFSLGANSKQVTPESLPSLCSDSSPTDNISFSGAEQWVRMRSLSEHAEESIVQGIWQSELSRPSSGLGQRNAHARTSLQRSVYRSPVVTSFPRPLSANIPLCGMIKSRPIQSSRSQIRPKSSTGQLLSTVVAEISKFEFDDLTEQDDPLLEDIADQQALASLEKELQSHIDPQEKLCRLTSEDLSASSRHSKKISENITDFHNNLELKDHSRVDTLSDCDENYAEEEEVVRDKQLVLALH
ncbi:PREDICTED: zinc finger B-box domain-containing protein 1 isoform X1 [Gavialis gangeticus]|uniref:zinc finger B-box domain-containing protein 1 isoform X1 n=2 Tax=Gavialis gangeticus TaxID=94835 RepID=UPI00092E8C10|nr:PREDICTED: zinc finger B-box domain-containing protein 1 isoform X1 [Gavialis gangeticus]XP_019358788.1 PREDICTED: zinc finger B-box domain-containing protein 1 isoform X1 [Gavialis gangeticus]